MYYSGNMEILEQHKAAFFCSQKCPSHLISNPMIGQLNNVTKKNEDT